ncbi:DUF4365 domain-containing protein [Micromonospora sp. NPDC049900]|uniref:DUF4365 domain-containing protein n=1 Tax=Micromonospora sp. NPDC049900 TaxID=3364275 RepID=UPI0037A54083
MPGLPQRPPAHVNAQRSEKAFAALFSDDRWVLRPVTPDYGRDLEVELFEDGQATGILFGVQLKSIDKAPRKGRLSKPGIETSSLRYWQKLDYPLMVATYSVPASQFYARWAHSYDWHHKNHSGLCTDICTPGPKTVTFHYGVAHQLTLESVDKLSEQLQFFRAARTGALRHSPMPIRVDGENVDGHSVASTTKKLRKFTESCGWIRLAEPGEMAVSLTFTQSEIRAVLPGDMRSATLHLQKGIYSGPQGCSALAADALVALSHLFFELNGDNAAADLIMIAASNSHALVWSSFDLILKPRLLEARRLDAIEAIAKAHTRRLRDPLLS